MSASAEKLQGMFEAAKHIRWTILTGFAMREACIALRMFLDYSTPLAQEAHGRARRPLRLVSQCRRNVGL